MKHAMRKSAIQERVEVPQLFQATHFDENGQPELDSFEDDEDEEDQEDSDEDGLYLENNQNAHI